ncbi:MAG: nitroreductase family protein [Salinivirgaceae bacterium]
MNIKPFLLIMTSATIISSVAQKAEFEQIIRMATMAPSGHNSQPWLFSIHENSIVLSPNDNCTLPIVDPHHRELYISLGAALENLCIAAREYGFAPEPVVQERNLSHRIKVILIRKNVEKDSLYEQIPLRQTNRSKFQNVDIDEQKIAMLRQIQSGSHSKIYFFRNETTSFQSLANLIEQGNNAQMSNNKFKNELLAWMRFNPKHVSENQDGLTHSVMGMPALPQFIARPLIKLFLNPKAQNKADMEKIHSSSHLVLFTTTQNDPVGWIETGRLLERFLLKTTELGIANAYHNQPCEVPSVMSMLK